MLSLTDSFTVLRLSENFAPPNLSDYLRASAAASIFFFPASCLAMSLQVQPAGGLNTRVTLCLFGLCASRINPAHFRVLVGLSGLEPPTSRLSGVRSNRLSYKPISIWQPPAFPYRHQYSIIGRFRLNHRVRDVDGCFPKAYRHQKIVSASQIH